MAALDAVVACRACVVDALWYGAVARAPASGL